jgi:hypothetical protein
MYKVSADHFANSASPEADGQLAIRIESVIGGFIPKNRNNFCLKFWKRLGRMAKKEEGGRGPWQ